MATTYELIASQTLGSNAATVTFSGIPQTYDDLLINVLARSTRTGTTASYIRMSFNSVTNTGHDFRALSGNGSTATSFAYTDDSSAFIVAPTGWTANTFGNVEIYVPNYAGSTNKSWSVSSVAENNATEASTFFASGLWRSTSAITEINFWENAAQGRAIAAGSSFYLFGITKA